MAVVGVSIGMIVSHSFTLRTIVRLPLASFPDSVDAMSPVVYWGWVGEDETLREFRYDWAYGFEYGGGHEGGYGRAGDCAHHFRIAWV